MTNVKKILVTVRPYDDYANVTEIVNGNMRHHKLGIRNTLKRNLPFVLLQQTLPPYTKIRIRLDKLGLCESSKYGVYEFYFEE